jgi:hypothetical protein
MVAMGGLAATQFAMPFNSESAKGKKVRRLPFILGLYPPPINREWGTGAAAHQPPVTGGHRG